jgi:hypothetical protein
VKPKLFDGPHAVGEAKARHLETLGRPFLTASGPDFSASTRIGLSSVSVTKAEAKAEEFYSFFTLGEALTSQQSYIHAAQYAGRFFRVSRTPVSGSDFALPNFNYIGGGWGALAYKIDSVTFTFNLSRDGIRFTQIPAFYSTFISGYGSYQWELIDAAVDSSWSRSIPMFGVSVTLYNATTSKFYGTYLRFENGGWVVGNVIQSSTYASYRPKVRRIEPSSLLAFLPLLHYGTLGSSSTPLAPILQKSTDGGASWTQIFLPSGFMTGRSISDVNMIDTVDGSVFLPMTPNRVVCLIPAIDNYSSFPYADYEVYELVGSSMTLISTIPYTPAVAEQAYIVDNAGPGPKDTIVLQFGFPGASNDTYSIIVSVDGGYTWTTKLLPWSAAHTGQVAWLDPSTIMCPAWDGAYNLYISKDLGDTWTFRSTISATTPELSNAFQIVNRFRDRTGGSAASTPGAPWVSNSSVSPPLD